MTQHVICDYSDFERLETYLRKHINLHFYTIGDLDDFFRPNTRWFVLEEANHITAAIMIYSGLSPATVIAISENIDGLSSLFKEILPYLPENLYAHLSPGTEQVMDGYQLDSHGFHLKMMLLQTQAINEINTRITEPLTQDNMGELIEFYKVSYPGNWFDPRMLQTGQYFGIRINRQLVSVAGIHVFSPAYRVAALGNIVTHPDFRKQGFGFLTSARVCQSLLASTDHIGLHVKADNLPAILCYKKLGFEIVGEYGEFMVTLRGV